MRRKISYRPLEMPSVFNWGDTTVNWSEAVSDYMAVKKYNRFLELRNRRRARQGRI